MKRREMRWLISKIDMASEKKKSKAKHLLGIYRQ
jgi:hypothetical protein